MTQDVLAKVSAYFRGIDEELVDTDALLHILDIVAPLWDDTDTAYSQLRVIVTLAVAAGVFRYHEHDHLQPLDRL